MKKTKLFSILLSAAMLFTQPVFAEENNPEYDKVEKILNFASNLYIDEDVDSATLWESALKSVLKDKPELANEIIKAGFQSLDDYTEFYTKEEYELFNKNINHIVYGIGVVIQQVDDYVTVMSVVKDGGAERAGVQSGDKISKVDGVDVAGQSVDKVQDMVVGELGTEVTVTFLREDVEYEAVITRAEVSGTTVYSDVLKGDIGYISIVNFATKTDTEFADVLEKFDEQGITKIILDLRDNPGGYLDSAVNASSLIVPEGLIVSTVYRNEYENEELYSTLKDPKYELAVLVNENTASAAEVMAGAIKDSGVGILIGDNTYGKGVVQQMFEMMDGCAFKITTGKYYTRDGNDINGKGIEPNEYVDNTTRQIDITKYQTFDYKTKPNEGETSKNVLAAKERLKIMGYYSGDADENFDKALKTAVMKFQEDNDLYPYGVLDISTQVKMENIFYKLRELVDNQLIYAYEYFGGEEKDLYE